MFSGSSVSVCDDEKVLELDSGDGYTTIVNALNCILPKNSKLHVIYIYIFYHIKQF